MNFPVDLHNECFLIVERKVSADWRELGRNLRVDSDTLNQIESDYHKVTDRCDRVLNIWMQKNGGLYVEILKAALRSMGRIDVVKEIDQLTK